MQRELNPFLFGTPNQSSDRNASPVDPSKPASGIMGKAGENAPLKPLYAPGEIKALEHQFNTLKLAFIQMEKKNDSMAAKMEEMARAMHGRLERFSQAILRLEEIQSKASQDATGKFAQVLQKVNERKVSDSKVQELIDRHNTIIRNFENRLLSLQRVVSEQEMALHNAQAALEEARAELSKRR